jgi:hypothetical protein
MRSRVIVVPILALPLGFVAGASVAGPGDFCDRKPDHRRCRTTTATTVPPSTSTTHPPPTTTALPPTTTEPPMTNEVRANLWVVP